MAWSRSSNRSSRSTTDTFWGFEVLARWNDPEQGFIGPDQFIPIADRFGLLDRLLDQLMRAAFSAAADWPHHIFLGFNVSPTQLRNPELATRIAKAAIDSSFPLSRVHIEVTENGFIDDLSQPRRTLDRLINLGCTIAMDDFGTGYSSLTWLSTLPFSKLKIDASFVMAMEDHRQSRKIVDAVVGLGHSLGLAVVAEGVETAGQADLLRGGWAASWRRATCSGGRRGPAGPKCIAPVRLRPAE